MSCRYSNRDKILEAAANLFYHTGYQATSVDDILKECKVAKSNFYYHFESKDQLALEVLENQIAMHEAQLLESLQNTSLSPTARLNAFFDQLQRVQMDILKMGGCPFGNLAASLPSATAEPRFDHFRQRLSACFKTLQAALADCLAAGMAQGAFRADIPPGEVATVLTASVQGLLVLTKTHQETVILAQGARVIMKLIETF